MSLDKARSEDPLVIAARKKVVEKLRFLQDNYFGEPMERYGLFPHWKREHWTNVFFPLPDANGGFVDYLRLGYGKPKHLVDELAHRSGVFQELTAYGTYDPIAFYYVAMVQLGLNERWWWVNFYMDDKAWLEQYNLLSKVAHPTHRAKLVSILNDLQAVGYQLVIYPQHGGLEGWVESCPEEFIDALAEHRKKSQPAMVSIELLMEPDAPENSFKRLPEFVLSEFKRLLPLYNFASWHPKKNNFLKGL